MLLSKRSQVAKPSVGNPFPHRPILSPRGSDSPGGLSGLGRHGRGGGRGGRYVAVEVEVLVVEERRQLLLQAVDLVDRRLLLTGQSVISRQSTLVSRARTGPVAWPVVAVIYTGLVYNAQP
jgi:hypothetical protein